MTIFDIRSISLDFEYCRKKISGCKCEIKRWGFEMWRWRKWISGVARFPPMGFARLNEKGGFAFLFKFLKIFSGKSLPEKFYAVLLSFYEFRKAQRKGVLRFPFRYFSFFLKKGQKEIGAYRKNWGKNEKRN